MTEFGLQRYRLLGKTQQTVLLRSVHLAVCKFYLKMEKWEEQTNTERQAERLRGQSDKHAGGAVVGTGDMVVNKTGQDP